jgi:para-aminobenzoate synthetase component I
MTFGQFIDSLNALGRQRVPCLFVIDFEMQKPLLWRLNEVDRKHVLYNFNGVTNASGYGTRHLQRPTLNVFPHSFDSYHNKFHKVMQRLEYGDSFLTNLTTRSAIECEASLQDLFHLSNAKYKLWLEGKFLFFSPETFVQIRDGKIFSYPMKGTIDATVPDAEKRILQDQKEAAEHVTIVDLIRNDLSMVASSVEVRRFRYVEEIRSNGKSLLQVSSEIVGSLCPDALDQLGNIIASLLPAGSVSGAPKAKTKQIIQDAEGEARGYYSGVCGLFDGRQLDTGVMIRFIEVEGDKLFYRSGGGITTQSEVKSEYQETLDKIYVPVY